jgi:small GTP-binding protein
MCTVLILGDAGVGKTAYCKRVLSHSFEKRYVPTHGYAHMSVDGALWIDVAGQEIYKNHAYGVDRVDKVILMYDVSSRMSFKSLRHWHVVGMRYARDNTEFVVCANKVDIAARKVGRELGELFASVNGAGYMEMSVKNGV